MAVRFAWSPVLVELRRQVCPNARWQKHSREWLMQDDEAQSFMRAAQAALEYQKWHTQITVDDTVWIVGFVQGAPYQLSAAQLDQPSLVRDDYARRNPIDSHDLRSDHLPGYGNDDSISHADGQACSIGACTGVVTTGRGEVLRVPKRTRASPVHREICCASFSIIRNPRRGLNDLVGATAALAG